LSIIANLTSTANEKLKIKNPFGKKPPPEAKINLDDNSLLKLG
jgi:hypothetical protein